MKRALVFALAVVALGACTSAPRELGQARADSAHAEVRVQADGAALADDAALASSVLALVEEDRARLVKAFGCEPVKLGVLVCRSRSNFDEAARVFHETTQGSVGFYVPRKEALAVIFWRGDEDGPRTLAHELVHHFVKATRPDAPRWWSEGLAVELSHSNDVVGASGEARAPIELVWSKLPPPFDRCPVARAAALNETDLAATLEHLENFDASLASYEVAGAVVRWQIDRRRPEKLSDLGPEVPGARELGAWIRGLRPGDVATLHDRFPPLDGKP